MLSQSSNLVPGIGDEIFTSIGALIIGALIFKIFHYFRRRNAAVMVQPADSRDLQPSTSEAVLHQLSNICPICLDQVAAIETNCGHFYCGICFDTMYQLNHRRTVRCAMCRQQVTLLFAHLDEEEANAAIGSEVEANRRITLELYRNYNYAHSSFDRSIVDHLRDLPILLRNLWSEFFTLHGMIRFRFRLRIGFYCSLLLFYLCIPFDLIPESIFGLLGLMDDVLISFLFLIYLAALYRRHILDR